MFPHFSRLAAAGDTARHPQDASRFAIVDHARRHDTADGLLILVSRPLAELLFHRGAVTSETISTIVQVQCCYLFQVPAYFVETLGIRAWALGGAGLISRVAAAKLGLNIAANLVLMNYFGIAGIALSTSCVQTFAAALIYCLLLRRLAQQASPPQSHGLCVKAA